MRKRTLLLVLVCAVVLGAAAAWALRPREPLPNPLSESREIRLGGEIFIHGRGSGSDWTWGCIALDDPEMKELFDAIPVGTPVVIAR